jgi:hypothetical protein
VRHPAAVQPPWQEVRVLGVALLLAAGIGLASLAVIARTTRVLALDFRAWRPTICCGLEPGRVASDFEAAQVTAARRAATLTLALDDPDWPRAGASASYPAAATERLCFRAYATALRAAPGIELQALAAGALRATRPTLGMEQGTTVVLEDLQPVAGQVTVELALVRTAASVEAATSAAAVVRVEHGVLRACAPTAGPSR